MSDEKQDATSALAALGVGPAAPEAYVDLIRPAARIVGKNLETVAQAINVAMAPIRGLVWRMERLEQWLASALLKRLSESRPEDIQPPQSYVAGQLLLQLQFCSEQEQLREMYANLLASAMLKDTATGVHPAFVQVIQQLTPGEAVILRHIASHGRNFSLDESYTDLRGPANAKGSISAQFRITCEMATVAHPELSEAYLDNLLRLKVLTEQRWSESEYVAPGHWADNRGSVKNTAGRLVELSAFGEHFIKTCVMAEFKGWHVGA